MGATPELRGTGVFSFIKVARKAPGGGDDGQAGADGPVSVASPGKGKNYLEKKDVPRVRSGKQAPPPS